MVLIIFMTGPLQVLGISSYLPMMPDEVPDENVAMESAEVKDTPPEEKETEPVEEVKKKEEESDNEDNNDDEKKEKSEKELEEELILEGLNDEDKFMLKVSDG